MKSTKSAMVLGTWALSVISVTAHAGMPAGASAKLLADAMDANYLTIGKVQQELIEDSDTPQMCLQSPLQTGRTLNDSQPHLTPEDLTDIVNLGKSIWQVVVDNQPVVDVSTQSASALPGRTSDWRSMQGWKSPRSLTYRMTYKNLYDMTVVDFSYRLLFTYGGNVGGKGQYLTNVTIVPANVNVTWGFKFSATASVPSITNAGTQQSPIAAAELLLSWKVTTVLQHEQTSSSYYVRGDGYFQEL